MSITRKYLYAMRLRPFSIGTYPKKGFARAEINVDVDSCNYHDLLVYDRRLKDEEGEIYIDDVRIK